METCLAAAEMAYFLSVTSLPYTKIEGLGFVLHAALGDVLYVFTEGRFCTSLNGVHT